MVNALIASKVGLAAKWKLGDYLLPKLFGRSVMNIFEYG